MQRSKLRRLLPGDESYDTDCWLTRLENKHDRDLVSAIVTTSAA
jgi:hypothetical protein